MTHDYDDDYTSSLFGALKTLPSWIFLIFGFAVMIMFAVIIDHFITVPYQITHIKAEPYVWPEGCEENDYNAGRISLKCFDSHYYIGDGSQWGWYNNHGRYSHKTYQWYRIGNDAIAQGCDVVHGPCLAEQIHENVFYQTSTGHAK